jgi:RNA polymerase sigma factor (sigma-70 family)
LKDWQNTDSWQEFYDIYSGLIYGMALNAGLTASEADDALQETLLTVAKQLKADGEGNSAFKYDPAKGSFKSFLFHTTRWRIDDQFDKRAHLVRKSSRRDSRTSKTPIEERIPDPQDFEAKWDLEWKENRYAAALERVKRSVKAKQYQVYDLYVVKNLPAKNVARLLGIRSAQVFLTKHRILRRIKKEIERLEKEIV